MFKNERLKAETDILSLPADALKDFARKCDSRIAELQEKDWERTYKESSGIRYLPLGQIVDKMYAVQDFNDVSYRIVMKDFFYRNYNPRISDLLYFAKSYRLDIPKDFARMICTNCICHNCEGYKCCTDCDECREHAYDGYSWECED